MTESNNSGRDISDAEWSEFLGENPESSAAPVERNRKGDTRGLVGKSVQNRFKKGQSGNPKGRPRGMPNFRTTAKKMLSMSFPMKNGSRVSKVNAQEGVFLKLLEKAMKGDMRAIQQLLALCQKYNDVEDMPAEAFKLSPEVRALVDRAKKRYGKLPEQNPDATRNKGTKDEENDK